MNIKEMRSYLEVQYKPVAVIYDRGINGNAPALTIVTATELGEHDVQAITERALIGPGQRLAIKFASVYRLGGYGT